MRRAVDLVAGTFLPALLLAGLALPATAQNLNRVVIQVNDRIATLYDYQTRLEDFRREVAADSRLSLGERRQRMAELPEAVYRNLLDELLMQSRADQLSIVFTEDEVDANLRRMREGYGFEDDEAFAQALAQTGTNLREFREQMRVQMRMQEVLGREVRSKIDIDEELARLYYRDHPEQFISPRRLHLREAVVLEEGNLDAVGRRALASRLRDALAAGGSFEELVAPHQEAGDASGVIDLGWVHGGDLAPELQAAVWDLQAGEVSAPVEGRGGLHVLQVVERQEEGQQAFNDVAEEARRLAANEAFNEHLESYMKELEEKSYVRLEPPPEAAGFRHASGELPVEPDLPAPADGGTGAAADPPAPASGP